jgi:hypothetical protein
VRRRDDLLTDRIEHEFSRQGNEECGPNLIYQN